MRTTAVRSRPARFPSGSLVRVKSVPRGVDKGAVGQVAVVTAHIGRGKQEVVTEEGDVLTLTSLRLEAFARPDPDRPDPPADADAVSRALAEWPDYTVTNDCVYRAPSETDLRGEVAAVGREFADLKVRFSGHVLEVCANTAPVTLEGVALGRFRMKLCVDVGLSSEVVGWVEVEALDPNPSAHNEEVYHPHVFGNDVCLGDAHDEVAVALRSGRLSDAAFLVNAVLTHWNPRGVYDGGDLHVWNGHKCTNCQGVQRDSVPSCVECGDDVCRHCRETSCRSCGYYVHEGCVTRCACGHYRCPDCCITLEDYDDQRFCPTCAPKCGCCRERFPASELEGLMCPGCRSDEEVAEAAAEAAEEGATPPPSTADVTGVVPPCNTCGVRPADPDLDGKCVRCFQRWMRED